MSDITDIRNIDFEIEDNSNNIDFELEQAEELEFDVDDIIQTGGTDNYANLRNKPQINFHTLEPGNNTYEYLGVEPTIIDITEQDIDNIIFGG